MTGETKPTTVADGSSRTWMGRIARKYGEWQRSFEALKRRVDLELNPSLAIPQGDVPEPIHRPVGTLPAKTADAYASFRVGLKADNVGAEARRVLLVGRMDFFGFAVAQQLNNQGFGNIVIADELEDGQCETLPLLEFEDVLGLSELKAGLERGSKSWRTFSQIFYFGPWGEGKEPLALPKMLLAAAVESRGRFISFASASSLGAQPSRDEIVTGRLSGLRPEGKASVTAHLMDRLAMRQSPQSYLGIKHYRTFGPGESGDRCLYGLVRRAFAQIRAEGKVSLPVALRPDTEAGRRRHDFLYIKDAAVMAVHLALKEGATGICEIGSGESHTVSDVVRAVFHELGCDPIIEYTQEIPVSVSPEPERADLSRLRRLDCSHEPMSMQGAVHDYIKEHLETGVLSWAPAAPLEPEEPPQVERQTVTKSFVPKKRFPATKTA